MMRLLCCVVLLAALGSPLAARANSMTVTTLYPTANEIVTTGWTDPDNAHADDDVFATAAPAQNATVSSRYYNFGFDGVIPTGDTILSVTISYQFKVSTTASIASTKSRVRIDGVDEPLHTGVPAEPTALAIVGVDVFGDRAWTPADLDDASFKVEIQAVRGNDVDAVTFSLDYVTVSVQHATLAPTAMADGHMLMSWSDGPTFLHLDPDGNVVDQITPPGAVDGWVINHFAQFQNSTYLILSNGNASPVTQSIMEFDQNLAYVRTVFSGIDWTDPAQNPIGYDEFQVEAYFIALDADGNIYLDLGSAITEHIWKYDNDGVFIELFDVGIHGVSNHTKMGIKPDVACEFVTMWQNAGAAIVRWDTCLNASIGTVAGPGGTSPRGQFNASCLDTRLYVGDGSSPAPYPLSVYDTDYNVLTTYASLSLPSGSDVFLMLLPVTGDTTMWVLARSTATAPATQPNTYYLQQITLADNTLVGSPVVLRYLIDNTLGDAMIWHTAPIGCEGGVYPAEPTTEFRAWGHVIG